MKRQCVVGCARYICTLAADRRVLMNWKSQSNNADLGVAMLQWLHAGVVLFSEIHYLKVSIQRYRPIQNFADGTTFLHSREFIIQRF